MTVIFKNGIQQNKLKVTMWDYKQMLDIVGLPELKNKAVEIHFGYEGLDEYIVVACVQDPETLGIQTQIPNSLLQQSENLIAYLYVTDTDEGSAKTVYRIDIEVRERGKPEDTSSDPDDPHYISGISELINKTEELIKIAEGAVQTPIDIYTSPTEYKTITFLTAKEEKDNG